MQVTLNTNDLHNVRVALLALMKRPEVDENTIKELLVLSDKFVDTPAASAPVVPSSADRDTIPAV